MNSVADSLPDDIKALKQETLRLQQLVAEQDRIIVQKNKELAEQHRQIADLFEQFRLFRHRLFGPSSEHNPAQPWLFNEVEQIAAEEAAALAEGAAAADDETATPTPTARGGRKPLAPELPRVEVVHELPAHEQQCACGCQLSVIGEDISEQLDIIPAKIQVIRHIRKKYACQDCESAPISAALPPQPIPKSNASPGLLAHIATAKYQDGLPLYRLESKPLQRMGLDLPRQTQARWMMQLGTELLPPLLQLAREEQWRHDILHCDETPVQVLKEPDKPPTSQSYMWVTAGGRPGRNVILFDYRSSRSGAVPAQLLAGYQGYLMTDGYEAYTAFGRQSSIEHLCCMAHARRHFIEAKHAQPKARGPNTVSKADVALNFIGKLYAIEERIRDSDLEERHRVRQQESVAVLQQLRAWLDKTLATVTPSGKLGKALEYLDKYWPKLIRFVERGDLPIDNNKVERAIKPFGTGRKNWLFSDTPNGAHASAALYSVIETAKANGREPYAYLRYLFKRLRAATTRGALEALLPWNVEHTALIEDLLDLQPCS